MTPALYFEVQVSFRDRIRPPYGWGKVFSMNDYTLSIDATTGLNLVLRTECVENLALILKKLSRWTAITTDSRIYAVERVTVTETITHSKLIERKLSPEESVLVFGPANA